MDYEDLLEDRVEEMQEDIPQNRLASHNALTKNQHTTYEEERTKMSSPGEPSDVEQLSRPPNEDNFNWQSSYSTVMERLKFLLFNNLMSDVTFIVGSQKERIPAHKFVLSFGSTVFEAMFYRMLATRSNEIELPDVEPSAFRNLLRFLYTDQVSIEPDTVMTTLYTAKKYAVSALEKHCVSFLESNLCSDNAFLLLSQARLFDESKLVLLCLDIIDKNTQKSLNADGFLDIDNETLELVLKRDTLRIREIKLYDAVVRWAEVECNRLNVPNTADSKRKVLKNCINYIRFPLMAIEEFAAGPAQSGLLSDEQIVSLFLYFTLNPKPVTMFSDAPRCCMTGREFIASRFLEVDSRWGYSGTSDRIRFQTDRRIFLAGFGLYGSIHGPSEYDVTIQVIQTHTTNCIGSNKTKFSCDGTSQPFRVMFKEPIEILPQISYIATATLEGSDTYYGTRGLRKLTLQCGTTGQRVTFQFSYAAGNNNGTSVEDGQIPEFIFYL